MAVGAGACRRPDPDGAGAGQPGPGGPVVRRRNRSRYGRNPGLGHGRAAPGGDGRAPAQRMEGRGGRGRAARGLPGDAAACSGRRGRPAGQAARRPGAVRAGGAGRGAARGR
ncbi:hypothetical protein G6F60_014528 [Rhizopus arrhizus]|nr:hypothetical protein G6F60_014528 [Rhizopus arrhizus]